MRASVPRSVSLSAPLLAVCAWLIGGLWPAASSAAEKQFTLFNRTSSMAVCAAPIECGRAGPALQLDIYNCGERVARHAAIEGRTGSQRVRVTDACGVWSRLRLTLEYFGTREICADGVNVAALNALYVWGPYERSWSDGRGVFECRDEDSPGQGTLVKNGQVVLVNQRVSPWVLAAYAPNGCRPFADWLGRRPTAPLVYKGQNSRGLHSVYNHDCGAYSTFGYRGRFIANYCLPMQVAGNSELILRSEGTRPACQQVRKSFDGL